MGYTCQKDTWFNNHASYCNRSAAVVWWFGFLLDQLPYLGCVELQEHTSRGKEKWLLGLAVAYSQYFEILHCWSKLMLGQSFILSSFFAALLSALFHRHKCWRCACSGELMGVEKLPILFLSAGHFLLICSVSRILFAVQIPCSGSGRRWRDGESCWGKEMGEKGKDWFLTAVQA